MTKITHEKCPDCGGELKEEMRRNKHCNGHWNEHRVFDCGAKFEFSPNFMATNQTQPCGNSPDTKLIIRKQKDATKMVKAYIAKLDVDEEFMQMMLDKLKYI